MSKKNRLLTTVGVVFLILTLAALPLAACAKEAPAPSPAPAPAPAPSPAPSPAPAPTPAPEQEVIKWQMNTYAVAETIDFKAHQEAFGDYLNKMTNGRLQITVHPIGTLVGYKEMLESLGAGNFDASVDCITYASGIEPGYAAIWSLPGLWPIPEGPRVSRIWFDHFGGDELMEEAYGNHNAQYVESLTLSPEPIMSKRPLRTLADFNGLKLRTAPGLTHAVFEKLGASPQAMSGGEVYTALDTGVIDAAEWVSLTSDYDAGLHEVTDYVLFPSFHGPSQNCATAVNQDSWNSLPEDLKVAFDAAAKVAERWSDYRLVAADYETLEKLKAAGLEHSELSEADMATVAQYGMEAALDWSGKSDFSKRVIDSVIAYLKLFGYVD